MEAKMPRKNAKAILRRGAVGLPPENDLEHILHGYCMLDGTGPSAPDSILWERYGSTLMSLQCIECNGSVPWHSDPYFFAAFERPALWWTCGPGAEEPRRLLSGDPAQAMPEKGLERGVPRWFKTMHHGCVYETQRAYILRRGLLTDLERELLEVEKQNGTEEENGGTEAGASVP
jgi:hypothetical protein